MRIISLQADGKVGVFMEEGEVRAVDGVAV